MMSCYGEALVDLMVSPYSPTGLQTSAQACLGGSVFNFCIAAQRQGMQAVYLNALSRDSFGRQFAAVLQHENVLLDEVNPCQQPTSIAVVQLDAQGKAQYSFLRSGVADTARSSHDIMAHWNHKITHLHTGCLMLVPEQWPQTRILLEHALARGCLVSVDANLRLAVCPDIQTYRDTVLAACAMAHWVKVSDDDLVALQLLSPDPSTAQAVSAAHALLARCSTHTQGIALTLGAQGAALIGRTAIVQQTARSDITVIDTVGAGDAFMAALLSFFDRQRVLNPQASAEQTPWYARALAHAVASASWSVQRAGSNPPRWTDVAA